MKEWLKEYDVPFRTLFYAASILLFIISLYTESLLLFLISLFFCFVNGMISYYFRQIAENLHLVNATQRIRMFVNDEDVMSLPIANEGKLPLFTGTFEFVLDDYAECPQLHFVTGGKSQNRYSFPISLNHRSLQSADIQLKGKKRGVAKFRGVHVGVHDWFGLGKMRMSYDPMYRTEIIIYPELESVYGLERIRTTWQGRQPVEYSLDEDLTSPSGSREYLSSDPFNRVHWKASAKTGELQTKIFEKTSGMTWVLILNVTRDRAHPVDLEREISCLAFICKFAAEHGIPFELYMNVKTRGKDRMMHLQTGEGREQLGKALELLARVNINSVLVPADQLLAYVDRLEDRNSIMIVCNLSYNDDNRGTLHKWRKKGFGLYRVEHREGGSYVINIANRKAVS
ncbi:MAG TPA: DUF58 domain-containing protein [Bacillales bacterium]